MAARFTEAPAPSWRRRFYEAVFQWRFEAWGPPDFYLVHTGDASNPGVQGLLHKRQQPRGTGGPNCFECTIAVDNISIVTEAIKKNGGRILMEKAPVPTVGVLTKFEDSEGNVLGAMATRTSRIPRHEAAR